MSVTTVFSKFEPLIHPHSWPNIGVSFKESVLHHIVGRWRRSTCLIITSLQSNVFVGATETEIFLIKTFSNVPIL